MASSGETPTCGARPGTLPHLGFAVASRDEAIRRRRWGEDGVSPWSRAWGRSSVLLPDRDPRNSVNSRSVRRSTPTVPSGRSSGSVPRRRKLRRRSGEIEDEKTDAVRRSSALCSIPRSATAPGSHRTLSTAWDNLEDTARSYPLGGPGCRKASGIHLEPERNHRCPRRRVTKRNTKENVVLGEAFFSAAQRACKEKTRISHHRGANSRFTLHRANFARGGASRAEAPSRYSPREASSDARPPRRISWRSLRRRPHRRNALLNCADEAVNHSTPTFRSFRTRSVRSDALGKLKIQRVCISQHWHAPPGEFAAGRKSYGGAIERDEPVTRRGGYGTGCSHGWGGGEVDDGEPAANCVTTVAVGEHEVSLRSRRRHPGARNRHATRSAGARTKASWLTGPESLACERAERDLAPVASTA